MKNSTETMNSVDMSGQYLSFMLGNEDYGIDILKVREIKGWEEVRPLPDTPHYIKGVLDLRGTIVPILDLRSRFNLDSVEYTPTTVTIVLSIQTEKKAHIIGVVVDGVSDVLDVKCDEIRTAPDFGTQINTRYIKGMVTQGKRMIVLLDADRLFDTDVMELTDVID